MCETAAQPGEDVRVSTPQGTLVGRWCGQEPAEPGSEHFIEIDVRNSMDWSDLLATPTGPYLEASVVQVEEDGVVTLDLGGSLVVVETTGTAMPECEGHRVCLVDVELEFFPYHL